MDALPLSLINDFLFCPRRAALKIVEGKREANAHTERGDIVHEHADLAGYEVVKGVTLLRALPVFSERLGLSGKCDIVEAYSQPVAAEVTRLTSPVAQPSTLDPQPPTASKSEPPHVGCYDRLMSEPPHVGCYDRLIPVEFKLGKRRQWENDDVQLCAQALCLEEMFGVSIPRGAVFHAQSKRRREVEFNPDLRAVTEQAVADLHALLNPQLSTLNQQIPPARYLEGRCEECSLFDICLPKVTGADNRVERLARQLFQI